MKDLESKGRILMAKFSYIIASLSLSLPKNCSKTVYLTTILLPANLAHSFNSSGQEYLDFMVQRMYLSFINLNGIHSLGLGQWLTWPWKWLYRILSLHIYTHIHPHLHNTAFYTTLLQNCIPPVANIVFSFSPFRLLNRVS